MVTIAGWRVGTLDHLYCPFYRGFFISKVALYTSLCSLDSGLVLIQEVP